MRVLRKTPHAHAASNPADAHRSHVITPRLLPEVSQGTSRAPRGIQPHSACIAAAHTAAYVDRKLLRRRVLHRHLHSHPRRRTVGRLVLAAMIRLERVRVRPSRRRRLYAAGEKRPAAACPAGTAGLPPGAGAPGACPDWALTLDACEALDALDAVRRIG